MTPTTTELTSQQLEKLQDEYAQLEARQKELTTALAAHKRRRATIAVDQGEAIAAGAEPRQISAEIRDLEDAIEGTTSAIALVEKRRIAARRPIYEERARLRTAELDRTRSARDKAMSELYAFALDAARRSRELVRAVELAGREANAHAWERHRLLNPDHHNHAIAHVHGDGSFGGDLLAVIDSLHWLLVDAERQQAPTSQATVVGQWRGSYIPAQIGRVG